MGSTMDQSTYDFLFSDVLPVPSFDDSLDDFLADPAVSGSSSGNNVPRSMSDRASSGSFAMSDSGNVSNMSRSVSVPQSIPLSPTERDPNYLSDLLNDPTIAKLLTAQAKQRSAPQQPTLTHSQGKVNCKRVRTREKDKLGSLQKQLDSVVQRFSELSTTNHQLKLRQRVLELFMEAMGEFEAKVAQVTTELEAHSKNPSQPPTELVAYKNMSVAKFISLYKRSLAEASKWVVCADDTAFSPESLEQLSMGNKQCLGLIYYASIIQPDLLARVKAELLKQFPLDVSEEQHWLDVVQAVQLTPDQEDHMMVALQVFRSCFNKMNLERASLGSEIDATIIPLGQANSLCSMACTDDDALIARLNASMNKQHTLMAVVCILLYEKVLQPLQVARCAVHAHPLMPAPIIMLTAIAANRMRTRSE